MDAINWLQLVLTAALTTVGALVGILAGHAITERSKSKDASDTSAVDFFNAAHNAAHKIGLGHETEAMADSDRSEAYWLVDREVAPRLRALQMAGRNPKTVTAAQEMFDALNAFRKAVARPDGRYVALTDETYRKKYEPYRVARNVFVGLARKDRGLPALTTMSEGAESRRGDLSSMPDTAAITD